MHAAANTPAHKADGRAVPWNKAKLIGQKVPLMVRLYRPRPEILNEGWKFPDAQPQS